MKKFLFTLLAITMLVSCNNDDDSNEKRKYATSVSIGGDTATFQYDDKKNLQSITSAGDVVYSFTYDSDNNLIAIGDDVEPFITIQYENGEMVSITSGDVTSPVTYNEQTKKFEIGGEASIEFGLIGRDLGTIDEMGGDNLLTMNYSSDHKGPFYSVPTKNTFLYALLLDLHYFTSTKPIAGVTENGTAYTTENTFDGDGYVTQMVMKSGDQTEGTITFQYSEL